METKNTINLQSVVDTHEQPFVIIDRDFTIVAVNRAYEQAYGSTRDKMVGQHCYQVSHQNDKPCFEFGEDCPYQTVYQAGQGCSCLHIHYDSEGHSHRVHINAYPLLDSGGELYLGEAIQDLSETYERRNDRIRMVGQSPVFLRMLEQLKLAAAADAPVLLQGETGTGKDLAANFIHQHSSRGDKPFLTLDCTVLTESLFEAEVFGHERGAFTGSVGEKAGLFEVVNGGTLFLDEIGEMPAQLQAKLLRVLETGEYRRVGGHKTLRTNARIICASNRNLGSDIESKVFREDLYYRIACLHIQMPALRERLQDVPLLAETLLDGISQATGRRYQLSLDSLMELQTYHYPGNIRELRNILSVAAAQTTDGRLGAKNITEVVRCMKSRRRPSRKRRASDAEIKERRSPAMLGGQGIERRRESDVGLHSGRGPETASSATAATDEHTLQTMEAQHIAELLKRHQGNRRQVADALGISERM
ncbi:MAG: sigma 54-interacting transcriptional regulator [Pseudomonadota bacterium]|nr:sigma 54-interacting transcriptional regulator [Pseudomonadota bacterium]